jgi:hypothetical protein
MEAPKDNYCEATGTVRPSEACSRSPQAMVVLHVDNEAFLKSEKLLAHLIL